MTFESIKSRGDWTPIRDCPGRYVLRGVVPSFGISDLVGLEKEIQRYHSKKARDSVWVAYLEDGGVISYQRVNGDWIHTLNTPEGFRRKLRQLEIGLDGGEAGHGGWFGS